LEFEGSRAPDDGGEPRTQSDSEWTLEEHEVRLYQVLRLRYTARTPCSRHASRPCGMEAMWVVHREHAYPHERAPSWRGSGWALRPFRDASPIVPTNTPR